MTTIMTSRGSWDSLYELLLFWDSACDLLWWSSHEGRCYCFMASHFARGRSWWWWWWWCYDLGLFDVITAPNEMFTLFCGKQALCFRGDDPRVHDRILICSQSDRNSTQLELECENSWVSGEILFPVRLEWMHNHGSNEKLTFSFSSRSASPEEERFYSWMVFPPFCYISIIILIWVHNCDPHNFNLHSDFESEAGSSRSLAHRLQSFPLDKMQEMMMMMMIEWMERRRRWKCSGNWSKYLPSSSSSLSSSFDRFCIVRFSWVRESSSYYNDFSNIQSGMSVEKLTPFLPIIIVFGSCSQSSYTLHDVHNRFVIPKI